MRRAKIVCTLGPASSAEETLKDLIKAGMNVARLNMSHGDYAEHNRRLNALLSASKELGSPVGVLADLQGPKIRLGIFANTKVELKLGQKFTITTEDILGDENRASTTFKGLPKDVTPGEIILIDDGRVSLKVLEVIDTEVITEVVVAGPVSNHKGINLPGVAVSVPALSEKDEADLRWALGKKVDMIALSFVRSADDIKRVHEIMDEEKRRLPVIAKLEKPQAIENLHQILAVFDGFMVARGDLGVEMPLQDVPMIQKTVIKQARKYSKPVIVATQMLESMISAPRPTRAEASDVANAILDGTDAVMLSGETAVGEYPVETVQTMANIITRIETQGKIAELDFDPHSTGTAIVKAAEEVARRVKAKYLIAFTASGETARRLSRLRSVIPLLVFSPEEHTRQFLTLSWGVETYVTPQFSRHEEMVQTVDEFLTSRNIVRSGDRVVVVSGSPIGVRGKTNSLRVHRIS